jgi:asparagine synthase (glutamine-hydrolysing)
MADVDGSLLLFCRDIERKVTVAVSGECADEIFGGYPWFYDKTIRETAGFPWSQNIEYRSGFLKPKFLKNIDAKEFAHKKYLETIESANTDDRTKQMTKLNMDWFMQTLLDRKDRMSMYNGLEVRVPFCDHRLVELAYNLPWSFKYHDGIEKSILRDAVADILPHEVLTRKKSPYPKTHNPEYLAAVSKTLREIIADHTQPIHKIIKKDALNALLKSRDNTPWYGQLMTVPQTIAYFIQLNYWLKKFDIKIKN